MSLYGPSGEHYEDTYDLTYLDVIQLIGMVKADNTMGRSSRNVRRSGLEEQCEDFNLNID